MLAGVAGTISLEDAVALAGMMVQTGRAPHYRDWVAAEVERRSAETTNAMLGSLI